MNDKILHALIGFIVLGRLIEIGMFWAIALLIVLFLGTIKELVDKNFLKGEFDWKDIVATVGGGVAYLLTTLIN